MHQLFHFVNECTENVTVRARLGAVFIAPSSRLTMITQYENVRFITQTTLEVQVEH